MKIDAQITFYYTAKYKETIDFYKNIVGFKAILDQGGCMVFAVTDSSYIGFCKSAKEPQPNDTLFTIVTNQVDQWYEKLYKQGVNFTKVPQLNEKYKLYHCFFEDPNGYLIEIQRFLDKDWNKSV